MLRRCGCCGRKSFRPSAPRPSRRASRRCPRCRPSRRAGVAVLLTGWLAVDAVAWILAAFERSAALGVLAAAAVAAGVAGGGAVIARELISLFRLKNVEAIHRRLAHGPVPAIEGRRAIADVLAVVPREPEVKAGIEAFRA